MQSAVGKVWPTKTSLGVHCGTTSTSGRLKDRALSSIVHNSKRLDATLLGVKAHIGGRLSADPCECSETFVHHFHHPLFTFPHIICPPLAEPGGQIAHTPETTLPTYTYPSARCEYPAHIYLIRDQTIIINAQTNQLRLYRTRSDSFAYLRQVDRRNQHNCHRLEDVNNSYPFSCPAIFAHCQSRHLSRRSDFTS